jgi:hypothetical protein
MYLSDDPIESEEDDSFGHTEYVDTLMEIVQSAEPPWHVGIFGEWGSGKSSIINLLYNRVRGDDEFDNLVCVEFDAWAHAEDSARTELLLELDKRIGEQVEGEGSDGTLGEEEITGRLYDVEEEESITKETRPQQIIKNFWNDSPILAIAFVGIAIAALAANYFGFPAVAAFLSTGLLLPILGYILQQLDTVTETVQRKFLYPRKEWTGAHQDIFNSIIKEADADKVVITIDNLDRCESSTVYNVLVSLKTFLEDERCIYLIPCDDEALESHLEAISEEDFFGEARSEREFLRKFFQTHIRIPPFQREDVEGYAHEQNQELSDELDEEAVDIIVNAYFENPRRIKHAINRLVTLRNIAREREDGGHLNEGRVTGNMPFLAKVSILEEEFPDFYQELSEDPYLLDDINSYFQDELRDSDKEKRVEKILEVNGRRESRLEAFLSSTQRVTTDNIRSFLNLSEQSYSSNLPDFDDVMRFLKTGQHSELLDRLDDIRNNGGSFDQYSDAIEDELRKYRSISRDQPMYAIINSLVQIFEDLEEDEQTAVAKVAGKYLTRDPGREFIDYLDAGTIFPVLIQMPDFRSERIFEQYANRVNSDDGLEESVLKAFIEHAEDIPSSVVDELAENVQELRDDNLREALRMLGDSDQAKEYLVTPSIIRVSTSVLEVDDGKNEYVQTAVYDRFDDVAGAEERSKYVEDLLRLREDYSGNQANQMNQSLARILNGIEPELTEKTADKVFSTVRELLDQQNSENVELVEACLLFFDSLPEASQDDFREWISTIFGQWNQQNLKRVFQSAVDSDFGVFETREEVNQFLSRIPNHINNESFIVQEVIPAIPPTFDEEVVEKTCELVRLNNNNRRRIGLKIIEKHPERLREGFNQVIDACGHQARNENSTNQKRKLLMPIAKEFKNLDGSDQEKFISELESLLRGNAGDYELYKEVWMEFADDADSDRRAAVAGDVLEDVVDRLNNQNPEHLTPVIEVLQSLEDVVENSQGQRFMERLSDRLNDQSLNTNLQETVINQIKGFSEFFGKEEQILDRLGAMLNSGSNRSLQQATEGLVEKLGEEGELEGERLEEFRENHLGG